MEFSVQIGLVVTLFASTPAMAGEIIRVNYDSPTFDQWVYPFVPSPGGNPTASTFSSNLPDGFPTFFDNRDGQVLLMFETGGDIPTGLDPAQYSVLGAVVTLMVDNNNGFIYDPTPDSYTSWLLPRNRNFVPDADPGRAIEMFGVGFRNGFTPATFSETSPYSFSGPFGKFVRNAFARSFDGPGPGGDVSNSVDAMTDPTPFAVGQTTEVTPGSPVPAGTTFSFALDTDHPAIQQYLREAMSGGRLFVMVASLFQTEQQGSNGFPRFFTKENVLVLDGVASAATLALNVEVIEDEPVFGDLNGDGFVDGADLGLLLSAWGSDDQAADLDDSGTVDGADLGLLLAAWAA